MPIVRQESAADPTLRWFGEARFGMFVHFGVYAALGKGEWVMYNEGIRREDYEKLAADFCPQLFDAEEWVDVAERAGARYITVTAKHHDGFCLFDSALTDWKITNTPFGRDLIAELVAACQRRGMRIILYYSQPDWHHPNYVHLPGAFKDLWYERENDESDWPMYQEYLRGQVLELVTHYGPIDGIWFDGSHKSEKAWQGKRLYELIKKHQPGAVVNDRARYGDFFTPERSLPEDLTGYLFEACESISCTSWGWKPDTPLHNAPHLIDSLVRMASAGGNYLLNVSPRPDGTIPEEQAARMTAIGDWLRIHGAAIYDSQACRLEGLDDDLRATRKGRDVYTFLRRWPASDHVHIAGIRSQPASARLLDGGLELSARLTEEGLEVSRLPLSPPDANPQAILLGFTAEPTLDLVRPQPQEARVIRVEPGRPTLLGSSDAAFEGFAVKGSRLHVREGVITGWMTEDQQTIWIIDCDAPGRYRVRIRLRCAPLYAGSTFLIRAGEFTLMGAVEGGNMPGQGPAPESTLGGVFHWQDVGQIELPAGKTQVSLTPTHMPYGYIFAEVKALELQPTKDGIQPLPDDLLRLVGQEDRSVKGQR